MLSLVPKTFHPGMCRVSRGNPLRMEQDCQNRTEKYGMNPFLGSQEWRPTSMEVDFMRISPPQRSVREILQRSSRTSNSVSSSIEGCKAGKLPTQDEHIHNTFLQERGTREKTTSFSEWTIPVSLHAHPAMKNIIQLEGCVRKDA